MTEGYPLRLMRTLIAVAVAAALSMSSAPADAAQSDVATAQRKANQAAAALSAAISQQEVLNDQVAQLEVEVAQAEADLASLRDRVRALAVEQYISGSVDSGSALLTTDIADAAKADTLASLALQQTNDDVDRYRQASAQLDDQRQELDAKKAQQQAAVNAADTAQKQAFAELAKAQKAEADRQAAEAAAAAKARAATTQTTTRTSSGTARNNAPAPVVNVAVDWVCPVQGAHSFSNDYGQPRSGHSHQGNDIFATTGTPIVAPVAGTVRDYSSGSGGNGFALDGADGNTYIGYHMNTRVVVTGSVAKGTLIGYVGSTGNSTAPHLHFEIHPGGGGAVNPYSTLSKYC